jgi:SWI/SNF-related matrix-associated actin-dependent regulator of chromatin subfamily A3
MTPTQLMQHDVVITTYNVLVSEHGVQAKFEGQPSTKKARKEKNKGLFDVRWKVILQTNELNTCT